MTGPRPPRRVRVTRSTPHGGAARTALTATRAAAPVTAAPARAEADSVLAVYDADLRRGLLRWAAAALAVVGIPLFGLPLVLWAVPGLATARVAGVPLPWLLLGLAVYPLVWAAALWFVTGAERTERDYDEAVAEREGRRSQESP